MFSDPTTATGKPLSPPLQLVFPPIRNVLLQLLRSRGGILYLASEPDCIEQLLSLLVSATLSHSTASAPTLSQCLVLPDELAGAYELASLLSYHLGALCDVDLLLSSTSTTTTTTTSTSSYDGPIGELSSEPGDEASSAIGHHFDECCMALWNLYTNALCGALGREAVGSVIALMDALRSIFDVLEQADPSVAFSSYGLAIHLASALVVVVLQNQDNSDQLLQDGVDIIERTQLLLRELEQLESDSDFSAIIHGHLRQVESWLQPVVAWNEEGVRSQSQDTL